MRRLAASATGIVLALAGPASALAQSAGDDQYRDPFAGEQQPRDDGNAPAPAPAPAPPSAPAPAPAPTADPAGAQPIATTAQLPRTGLGAGWVAASGFALIAAGIVVRRTVTA